MHNRILVVEDDHKTLITLAYRLEYAGYHVTQAPDGQTALDLLEQEAFAIVLTDILLGDIDGIEILHTAKLQSYRPVVILLTGHGSLDTSIAAVREGAYDYLLKPCPPEQLLASVEGAIKRYSSETQVRQAANNLLGALSGLTPETPHAPVAEDRNTATAPTSNLPETAHDQEVRIGELCIGSTRHEVTFQQRSLKVTPMEYALLQYLSERPGQVCRCNDIVRHTHGLETNESDAQNLLRSHIRNLRRKLDPDYLVNVRGTGYMLVDPNDYADIG
jgi:DNA-binding response OmpR family regulator